MVVIIFVLKLTSQNKNLKKKFKFGKSIQISTIYQNNYEKKMLDRLLSNDTGGVNDYYRKNPTSRKIFRHSLNKRRSYRQW